MQCFLCCLGTREEPWRPASAAPSSEARSALLAAVRQVAPTRADLHRQVQSGSVVPIFGYGSNNVEQLRGRLQERSLQEFAAMLPGYVRVFGGPNKSWSVGGRLGDDAESGSGKVCTASLLERSGGKTLGNVVLLSSGNLEMLHGFEGYPNVYTLISVSVVLRGPDGNPTAPFPALAYTRVWSDYVSDGPPEAYLCAARATYLSKPSGRL
eukprot:3693574-Prymnesium_polylepis.1